MVISAFLVSACGASPAPSSTPPPVETRTYPPVPSGGTDCGITDEMSGWPTTTVPGPATYTCLTDALDSGRPARFVVIRPSNVDSARRTSDGYTIPAGILVTYRVLGPHRLQVTTDRREAGGRVTVQNCTGLSPPPLGTPPTPSGCSPG